MSKKCVWVREVGVLSATKDKVATWEIWDVFTTKRDAVADAKRDFEKRPSWVTAKFHKATNRIVKYIPAAILLFALLGCSSKPDLTCGVIHAPQQGCPAGYVKEARPRFTEKDGSKEFACVDKNKPQCFDVLKPGEGMSLTFEFQEEEPPEQPKI